MSKHAKKIEIVETNDRCNMNEGVKYNPPLKSVISFNTVKSKIIGINERINIQGTVMIEQKDILFENLNKVKKILQPITNNIGEIKNINPAKEATAFPPLKCAKTGRVCPIKTLIPVKQIANSLKYLNTKILSLIGVKDITSKTMSIER